MIHLSQKRAVQVQQDEAAIHPETVQADVAVSLKNVSLTFETAAGPQRILDNINLDCRRGELLALVGRSGCGKTTILNLAAGLLAPTSGEIRVLGGDPVAQRRNVAYMFARDCLMPWRTALRNTELGLQIHGIDREKRERIARDMLAKVHLEDAVHKYPWQLSQGMRQRVAIARTWAMGPSLLLMDEPFSALDAQTREEVSAQFLEFWEASRRSVIFVTHDLGEALFLADRVILLGKGVIQHEVVVPFDRPRDPKRLPLEKKFIEIKRHLLEFLE